MGDYWRGFPTNRKTWRRHDEDFSGCAFRVVGRGGAVGVRVAVGDRGVLFLMGALMTIAANRGRRNRGGGCPCPEGLDMVRTPLLDTLMEAPIYIYIINIINKYIYRCIGGCPSVHVFFCMGRGFFSWLRISEKFFYKSLYLLRSWTDTPLIAFQLNISINYSNMLAYVQTFGHPSFFGHPYGILRNKWLTDDFMAVNDTHFRGRVGAKTKGSAWDQTLRRLYGWPERMTSRVGGGRP